MRLLGGQESRSHGGEQESKQQCGAGPLRPGNQEDGAGQQEFG